MYGTVISYYRDKGYGFIREINGSNVYFIHGSRLHGEYLEAGYTVFFKPAKKCKNMNDGVKERQKPKVDSVIVIEAIGKEKNEKSK